MKVWLECSPCTPTPPHKVATCTHQHSSRTWMCITKSYVAVAASFPGSQRSEILRARACARLELLKIRIRRVVRLAIVVRQRVATYSPDTPGVRSHVEGLRLAIPSPFVRETAPTTARRYPQLPLHIAQRNGTITYTMPCTQGQLLNARITDAIYQRQLQTTDVVSD